MALAIAVASAFTVYVSMYKKEFTESDADAAIVFIWVVLGIIVLVTSLGGGA